MSDLWRQLIVSALESVDARPVTIVLPMTGAVDPQPRSISPYQQSGRWDSFEKNLIVANEAEDQMLAALQDAAQQGPVLTEVGYRSRTVDPRERRRLNEEDVHDLATLALHSSDVVVGLQLPLLWLTARMFDQTRNHLRSSYDIRCVLIGRRDRERRAPGLEMACLVMSKGIQAPQETIFFQMPEPQPSMDKVMADFDRLIAKPGSQSKYGYWADLNSPVHSSLGFDVRNPKVKEEEQKLRTVGDPVQLSALFDVITSPNHHQERVRRREQAIRENRPEESDWYVESSQKGAVREIGLREVQQVRVLPSDENSRYRLPLDADLFLEPEDLVLPVLVKSRRAMRVCQITEEEPALIAGRNLLILRPKEESTPQQVEATALFLRSEIAMKLLSAQQGIDDVVRPGDLRRLEIPIPDGGTLDAVAKVTSARNDLQEWLQSADSVLGSLYSSRDRFAAKQEVLEMSRLLRSKVDQGKAQDDPYARYRSTYPFPVALAWRTAESAHSSSDEDAALKSILAAAETTTAYAACIALIMAREQNLDLPCLKEVRKKLASGRSGMSFGDWANILNEASTSKAARQVDLNSPLTAVQEIARSAGFEEARARLNKWRLDLSHNRGPSGMELGEAVESSFEDLVTLLDSAGPLSDLSLTHIEKAQLDTFSNETTVRFRDFSGDHPVVPYQSSTVEGVQLEVESLYVRDTDGSWHLMRPYLVGENCPRCHNWTMFIFDRVPGGVPQYRPVDHGHEHDRPDLLGPLRRVGLVGGEPSS